MINPKLFLISLSVFCIGTMLLQAQTIQAAANDATLWIGSATTDGKPVDGMWVEIRAGQEIVHSGYTPLSFNGTVGGTYVVDVSDYEDLVFSNWYDGSTTPSKTISLTQNMRITAYYVDKSQESSSASQPDAAPLPMRSMGAPTATNSTQPLLLPFWLREVASMWLGGQLNDREFITYLQRLVDEKILAPPPEAKPPEKQSPKPEEGFSKLKCTQSDRYVEMVGKYTNGARPYEIVSLRMVVLDSAGEILASGSGKISDLGAHQSKYFSVVARHHLDFASCDVQVESVLPKLPSRN